MNPAHVSGIAFRSAASVPGEPAEPRRAQPSSFSVPEPGRLHRYQCPPPFPGRTGSKVTGVRRRGPAGTNPQCDKGRSALSARSCRSYLRLMTTTVTSTGWRFTVDEPDERRGGTGLTLRAVDARGAAAEAQVEIADCTHQGLLSMRIGPVMPPAGVLGRLARLAGSMAAEHGAAHAARPRRPRQRPRRRGAGRVRARLDRARGVRRRHGGGGARRTSDLSGALCPVRPLPPRRPARPTRGHDLARRSGRCRCPAAWSSPSARWPTVTPTGSSSSTTGCPRRTAIGASSPGSAHPGRSSSG